MNTNQEDSERSYSTLHNTKQTHPVNEVTKHLTVEYTSVELSVTPTVPFETVNQHCT